MMNKNLWCVCGGGVCVGGGGGGTVHICLCISHGTAARLCIKNLNL